MKNTNFFQNNNNDKPSVNKITSSPEQSPIIFPAKVETPMVLRGEVEIISGSQVFAYTNIENGEFKLGDYSNDPFLNLPYFWSFKYMLAPESAEGDLIFSVYCNGEIFDTVMFHVKHKNSNSDSGMIGFFLHSSNETTDIFKMTAFTKFENIIFADVTNSDGTVKSPALTLTLEEC